MNNLKAEMARSGVTAKAIQKVLGCSEKTVYNKINGKSEFTILEACKIREEFFSALSIDYLFKV